MLAFSAPVCVEALFPNCPRGNLLNISPSCFGALSLPFLPSSLCLIFPRAGLRRPEPPACNKQHFARERSPRCRGAASSQLSLWSGTDRRAGAPCRPDSFRRRRSDFASGDRGFLPSDGTKGRTAVVKERGGSGGLLLYGGNMIIPTPSAGVVNWYDFQMSA